MRWEDVLKRDDIVNGDIVLMKDGVSIQGQIIGLATEGDEAVISLSWRAQRNECQTTWRAVEPTPIRVRLDQLILWKRGERRIRIVTAFDGAGFFLPIGDGMTLDPTEIQGLPKPIVLRVESEE